jgi:pyruvate dehydrogenase E2 component (dihydrolipoamide acetyltransferase)
MLLRRNYMGQTPEDVILPHMGPAIPESKIVKWHKSIGDRVERDEPLFDITNSYVDAEVPSPYAGELSEVLVEAGKTVPTGTVVARIKRRL